jgi:hypothetical protein
MQTVSADANYGAGIGSGTVNARESVLHEIMAFNGTITGLNEDGV